MMSHERIPTHRMVVRYFQHKPVGKTNFVNLCWLEQKIGEWEVSLVVQPYPFLCCVSLTCECTFRYRIHLCTKAISKEKDTVHDIKRLLRSAVSYNPDLILRMSAR